MSIVPKAEPNGPSKRKSHLFYQIEAGSPTAERGEGIYIWDTDGKKYLDACGGAFCANIGHGNKRVLAAAVRQMEKISFAYRTQFQNEPAHELARLLVDLSPAHLQQVFLVHSGSEAVESCLKLARQYWFAQGKKEKSVFISRRPSYHGATLGALAMTSYDPLNIPFEPVTLQGPKVPAPFCYRCPLGKDYPSCGTACANELEQVIEKIGADKIAAFITEPVGGASTGGAVPPDEWFSIIEKTCRKHGILLILDEVLTGCGRTGKFYGFEHWGVKPDLVALAKGMGAGYAPVGAALARQDIVDEVLKSGGFMHGHTTAGNPLTSAIACEVLKVVVEDGLVENARVVGEYLHEKLRELKLRHNIIGDVRGRGLLAGIEFVKDRSTKEPFAKSLRVADKATSIARDNGLLIYPRRSIYGVEGDHVSLAPPLNIDRAGIDEIIALLDKTFAILVTSLEG